VRIFWTPPAVRDPREIWTYVAKDKPEAATRLVTRLKEASQALAGQPHLGHAGRVPHTRELVVPGTPYILVYRLGSGHIEILAALHGARSVW
jgi:toxin ParE1/3/4